MSGCGGCSSGSCGSGGSSGNSSSPSYTIGKQKCAKDCDECTCGNDGSICDKCSGKINGCGGCKKDSAGCYCRACNDYNEFGEPDNVIQDGKFTCWSCGHSSTRKGKGLPPDKVQEIDKIYKKK